MPFNVTAESNYELPPAGLHPGVCVDFVDEGMKPTQFGEKHKVRYVFQIEERNSKGNRFTVSAWFNLSMHENSSLRQFLEQWRGVPFGDELNHPPGFDLESVVGVPCTLNVVLNESGGKTYANIAGISKHSPRMGEALEPEGYTRKQDREAQEEEQGKHRGADAMLVAAHRQGSPFNEDEDEIPF